MAQEFYHEEIQAVPAGYQVRTITHPSGHEVRLAFPPGRRKRGSGRLIEILHPHGAKNPCSKNPWWGQRKLPGNFELTKDSSGREWITGRTHSGKDWLAEGYPVSGKKMKRVGHPVEGRGATESDAIDRLWDKIEPNPRSGLGAWKGNFSLRAGDEKLQGLFSTLNQAKAEAKRLTKSLGKQVRVVRSRNPSGTKKRKANRKSRIANRKSKRNLDQITQAQKLYEEFSGRPAGKVTMINEPVKARDDYAHLGWVEWVAFHLAYDDEGYDPRELSKGYHELMEDGEDVDDSWKEIADEFSLKLRVFDFQGDEIRLAASPQGNQLYFLGGNQPAFAKHLGSFHTDTTRDRVLLGEVVALSYEAKKEQLGDKKPTSYYHVFAEESGEPPVAYWDALSQRIMLVGGNYSLDNAKVGIVN